MKYKSIEDVRGVIFDYDGVILDSEKYWAEDVLGYLKGYFDFWNNDETSKLIGMSNPAIHAYLKENYGLKISLEKFLGDYEDLARAIYATKAKCPYDLLELLKILKKNDEKIVIASSSPRRWIDLGLKSNGIESYFEHIISVHDLANAASKPAPDVYIKAMAIINEKPENLFAIEDSRNGIISAKSAGLFCVGYDNKVRPMQDLSKADAIVEDFSVLTHELNTKP